MNHKLRFGNLEFEMSLRHPKTGDILLAVGDMGVEFGEVKARDINVGVTGVREAI